VRRRPLVTGAALPAVALSALALAWSFGAPWLAEEYVDEAAGIWPDHPRTAYDRLDRARSLNPLSARPDLVGGSIALRLDDRRTAERRFRAAIAREPGESYGHLELGAILVDSGRRAEGIRTLARARALHPRDFFARNALKRARRGGRIDIARMNEDIRRQARELGE
jgi:predicted Zn-dependent protease